jgi:hypothetical protein
MGDTLVIGKPNGRADVRKLTKDGLWAHVRDGLPDLKMGWEIACSSLPADGHVWYRDEFEGDFAIRPYHPR